MADHYPDHPVLDDPRQEPATNLFDEMDAIADELRSNPLHVPDDNKIALRQLPAHVLRLICGIQLRKNSDLAR